MSSWNLIQIIKFSKNLEKKKKEKNVCSFLLHMAHWLGLTLNLNPNPNPDPLPDSAPAQKDGWWFTYKSPSRVQSSENGLLHGWKGGCLSADSKVHVSHPKECHFRTGMYHLLVDEICYRPVDEICNQLVHEICDKLVHEIFQKPEQMKFVQVDEVCDQKLVDERCDELTDGTIICDEHMDGICEQPVDETCVKLVDEICDKRVGNACDQTFDETCNKSVDEIRDRCVDKICEGPVDEIFDRRVDKICEEPVDEICFGQGSRKNLRESAREKREREQRCARYWKPVLLSFFLLRFLQKLRSLRSVFGFTASVDGVGKKRPCCCSFHSFWSLLLVLNFGWERAVCRNPSNSSRGWLLSFFLFSFLSWGCCGAWKCGRDMEGRSYRQTQRRGWWSGDQMLLLLLLHEGLLGCRGYT